MVSTYKCRLKDRTESKVITRQWSYGSGESMELESSGKDCVRWGEMINSVLSM